MTAETQQILQNLSNKVTETQNTLTKAQKDLDDAVALAKEYERQIRVHTANNDTTNANIVAGWLDQQYKAITTLSNARDKAKADYDSALNEYNNAKNTLLTPEEKQAVVIEAQAKAKALTDAAALEKANYFSKNVKVIVIGIVVIVIIAGVWYFKYKAKKGA